MALEQMKREANSMSTGLDGGSASSSRGGCGNSQRGKRDYGASRAAGGASQSVTGQASDGFSYGKLTVTNYVCNICNAQYKHHCNLLTHQIKAHGREKKKGTGRPLKNAASQLPNWDINDMGGYEIQENADYN